MNQVEHKTETRFFMFDTVLGPITVGSDDHYIESILFVKEPESKELEMDDLAIAPAAVHQCMKELNEYFEGKRFHFDFPIRQDGTPFQQSVWEQLLKIPYGRTISYLDLSKRIGNMKAVRAVGSTNGKNQLCIVVPCHRVIGSNGHLVGYGGELWRKKWLLEHEARWANGIQTLFNAP